MNIVKVVCGIIWQDQKVFVGRRKEGKALAGYWEFPGGKIEPGETPQEALIRELREELGMEVAIGKRYPSNLHYYAQNAVELIPFDCRFLSWDPIWTDHDAHLWATLNEVNELTLAPADVSIAKSLIPAY